MQQPTKSIITTSDADSEFQIIRAKSEFVDHNERFMPFEPQVKKVESSILNKKDVLRFTKQEIIEMYEAMIQDRDEQIKFLQDKVVV